MGYRSTFITNDFYNTIPEWFVDKYKGQFNFGMRDGKPADVIASKYERKYYSLQDEEVFEDIAKIIREMVTPYEINGALVHEDGYITQVTITADTVIAEHLTGGWQLGDGGTNKIGIDDER